MHGFAPPRTPTLPHMGDVATYATELAVGLGCLIGAVAAVRRPRLRWLGGVLLIAGLAAVVHAVGALIS